MSTANVVQLSYAKEYHVVWERYVKIILKRSVRRRRLVPYPGS
jgi:hypothetical protein